VDSGGSPWNEEGPFGVGGSGALVVKKGFRFSRRLGEGGALFVQGSSFGLTAGGGRTV